MKNWLTFLKPISFVLFLLLLNACARPIAKFEVPSVSTNLTAPATINFKNLSEKGNEYLWNFGDGTTSRDSNPTHIFKNSGNYEVALTVKNGSGKRTFHQRVQVLAPTQCTIEIETEHGTMLAILYSATPKHQDNFVKLANEAFFNNLLFHRVINGFMIQGGDPNSRNAPPNMPLGMGGPGYQIPAEFVDSLIHTKGALAAARTNNPKKESSGSQFYIVQGRPIPLEQLEYLEMSKNFKYSSEVKKAYQTIGGTPMLDREYTVFGRVIKGLEVIDKIATVPTAAQDRPVKDVKMKIRVVR